MAWGDNNFGQCSVPALPAGQRFVEVAAGGSHSCAILDNSEMKCWGENGFGQLGQGNTTDRGDDAGDMGNALRLTGF